MSSTTFKPSGLFLKAAAILACVAIVFYTTARAQENVVRYHATPGGKVRIEGTSTIHDWSMEGEIIGGWLELPPGISFDPAQAALTVAPDSTLNARAEINIPVRSIKSAHEGMDEVMQQAMNADTHPTIKFHLTTMKLKQPHTAGQPFQFDTTGDLIVNSVTNQVSMVVTMVSEGTNRLRVLGSTSLKMTDFQVKPPAPAIGVGLIRTGDDVKIFFEWPLAPVEKPAGKGQ